MALAIRARVVIFKKITIFYIVDELYTLRDVEPKRFSMYGPSMLENKNYTNFARKCNTWCALYAWNRGMNWYKNKPCAIIATRKTSQKSATCKNINSNKEICHWKNLLACGSSSSDETAVETKNWCRTTRTLKIGWSNIQSKYQHNNIYRMVDSNWWQDSCFANYCVLRFPVSSSNVEL